MFSLLLLPGFVPPIALPSVPVAEFTFELELFVSCIGAQPMPLIAGGLRGLTKYNLLFETEDEVVFPPLFN